MIGTVIHQTDLSPRVAVFRALKLGDLLCAVPALRALRAGMPGAEITLVGLPWAAEFADRYPHLIDDFVPFPGYPGLPEREADPRAVVRFLSAMQDRAFDLAIQMHGSGSYVNSLMCLWGAKRTAGFFVPGDWCPDAETYAAWPDRGLEVRRLLQLTSHLGFPSGSERLEFPLRTADSGEADELLAGVGSVVCIHPGASVPERRWPAERFAAVADRLARRGFAIVLTGSAGEAGLTHEVATLMRAPAIDLAGRTTLGSAAAILRRARLLIANDTGVSHLAAAVGTPSVIVSTGDNPARWAPIDRARHRVLCRADGVPSVAVGRVAEELLYRFRPAPRWRREERRPCDPCAC